MERQLRGSPNALRIVHGQLWLCYDDGVTIHFVGEQSLLEERRFLSLHYYEYIIFDAIKVPINDILDVTGTSQKEFAVAASDGLYIFKKPDEPKEPCKLTSTLTVCQRVGLHYGFIMDRCNCM